MAEVPHSIHMDAVREILTMSSGPLRKSGMEVIKVTAHSRNTALELIERAGGSDGVGRDWVGWDWVVGEVGRVGWAGVSQVCI